MSKKNKRKLTPWEALAIASAKPVTKIESQPRETLKAFQHKYEQDQQKAREAEKKEKNAQLAAALFTEESAELAARCDQIAEDHLAGFTTEQVKVLIRGAFDGFRLALEDQGIKLEPTALIKLQTIARQNLTLNVANPSVWQKIYEHAVEVGALTDRDVTRTQVTAQPAETKSSEDFDTVLAQNSTESREGRQRIADAAMQSMQTEAADMFTQWSRLLYDTWGVILSESQKQAVAAWFMKWNKPYRRHESWNECRRAMVKSGIFDSRMILPDEALADAIENQTVSLDTWEARQDFARRARLLTQK